MQSYGDKLEELKKKAASVEAADLDAMERGRGGHLPTEVSRMYDQSDLIQGLIDNLRCDLQIYNRKHTYYLTRQGSKDKTHVLDEIHQLVDNLNETSREIKAELTSFQAKMSGIPEEFVRPMKNLHAFLTTRFREFLRLYQEMAQKNRQEYLVQVRHQYEVASGNTLNDEQLDSLVTDPKFFTAQILRNKRLEEAQFAFAYVQEQYGEIQELGRRIETIYQLFTDMAVLVEQQGEMLDQIEHHAAQTVEDTEKTRDTMIVGAQLARRGRKKMLIILSLIACIVCAVLIVLAVLFVGIFCGQFYRCKR